jgi:hypothetical protein
VHGRGTAGHDPKDALLKKGTNAAVGTKITADETRNGRSLKSFCLLRRQILVNDSNKKKKLHYVF